MALLPRKTNLRILFAQPTLFARFYWLSLTGLLLGTLADLFTTLHNERLYGPQIEVHVVQRWLSEYLGIGLGVAVGKMGQAACVILVAAWWRPWCRTILLICGFLYALAALSNRRLWL